MLNIFEQIAEWRERKYVSINYLELNWTAFHISIVGNYLSNLSMTCHFPKLPSAAKLLTNKDRETLASFRRELKELFVVPMLLNNFHESEKRTKKYQLVEAFISFLLQLLYRKPDSVVKDRFEDLEKELRFLHSIIGDTSFMQCDEHEEFQKLLPQFEAVANEAGSLVHTIFFPVDPASGEIGEEIGVFLNNINALKANLMNFFNIGSSISRSAWITPKTSLVDSFLILNSLIQDLEDMMKREDSRICDVKDQIKLLHQGLVLLQSSIKDMGSPQPSEIGELKEPLMRIGDTAREIEYLVTCFLVGDAPLWYLITRLSDVNHKIEHIGTELQEITKMYKFEDSNSAKYSVVQMSLQDKRDTEVNDITVGFEDMTKDILDQLVGGGTKWLQVIAIFGMPGLGKTTLAKKLYNHPLINDWFDRNSWYVVSQNYERQILLANILIHINSELGKDRILKMEEETLVEHIYKTLKGRRYLIVMDDVWDSNVWYDFMRCFPDDGNGSRILLTSRNKDVAPSNSIIHELPFLSDEQCWELLEKKVFGNRPCPPELQGIGMEIASKCCGLPLTIVVIAGILSTVDREKSTWEKVGANLASYIDGGDGSVMQILELSYKHLPDHLKPCFLLFGAFEEDEEIRVGNLMRLWIAEGFIRKEKEKSAENIAREYLMELIKKSLVMVTKRSSDGRRVKACVIHDLLHDLCLKRSEEENFMKILKRNFHTMREKGHHVRAVQDCISLSCCQHVRSIYGGKYQTSAFYVRDMRLLRVLHFSSVLTRGFIGVEYLLNLRYLIVRDLPASIESLVNLEYLRVVSSYNTIYLHPAVASMIKLRYFKAFSLEYGECWNSSQTNNLEYLSRITIKELKDEEMLKCSPHLRKLKCIYELRPWEKEECPHFDIRFLTQLVSLHLRFRYNDNFSYIKEFGFPANIRKLSLSFSMLAWEKMSIIGRLEKLEVLKLVDSAFKGKTWDARDGEFQKLRFLELEAINFTQWNVLSSEHFPKLQQLVLSNCRRLLEIPSEIGEITTLQLIEVKNECPKSLVESAERIQQEQRDMGNEELEVIFSNIKHNVTTGLRLREWPRDAYSKMVTI